MELPLGCARQESKDLRAAHDFVQGFYDWYTPIGTSMRVREPAMNIAVRKRSSSIDSTLLRLLRIDVAHQNDSPGYITGIDYDPFLSSNDPCERYNAGSVTVRSNHYRVNVVGECNPEYPKSFIAVVRKDGKRWLLENVEDGKGNNAVAALQASQSNLKK
jgi:hypothetical protein